MRRLRRSRRCCRRERVSAAHLTVALQCGGSEGYSGITANLALGAAVDLLVAQDGTATLEQKGRENEKTVPWMIGAQM
jgi:altronate dehydratase